MAAIPVPTIPVRMNNFSTTLSTNTFRGVTQDGLHMCWTTGSGQLFIQRIGYDNNERSFFLNTTADFALGTSISSFQGSRSRAPIYVAGNRVWTMTRGSGNVREWDRRSGNLVTKYPSMDTTITDTFPITPLVGDFFAQWSILRRDPVDNKTIVRSYFYDNTSYNASVIANRRSNPVSVLTYDYSLDNFTLIRRTPTSFGSNNSYGLLFNGSNTLVLDYNGGINSRVYGFLNNDVDPGTVPIRNEDKVRDLYFRENLATGNLPNVGNFFINGISELSPLVQVSSSSSGATFSLFDFNSKYFVLRANNGGQYCLTRGYEAELLIPKSFIDPFSNSIITPNLGTFTMRMYTDGNTFGTIASVDGLQFLFLAAFPANKSVPINNYSLGIGAKKP